MGISGSHGDIGPHKLIHVATTTFFHSLKESCNTLTVLLLLIAAGLSLVFGLKEDGWHHVGWLNGVVLFFTILMVIICTTIKSLMAKRSIKKRLLEICWWSKGFKMQVIKVFREGRSVDVTESELVVGDIVILGKGDRVPGDGLFVAGDALKMYEGFSNPTIVNAENPFLLYGSKVIDGHQARMLVTSSWTEMMSQARSTVTDQKFESQHHKWNTWVTNTGLSLSILIIIVLFVRFCGGKKDHARRFRPESKGEPTKMATIMDVAKNLLMGTTRKAIIAKLSLSFVGITEITTGVIIAAIILWNRQLLRDKAVEIRDYLACFWMASVTVICIDKSGGLREVDKFYLGEEFVSESSVVNSEVVEALIDGICLHEQESECDSKLSPVASWAEARFNMKRESVIGQCKIIDVPEGQNPLQESCRAVIQKNGRNEYYLHFRGPLQAILPLCSHQYDINGEEREMDQSDRSKLEQINNELVREEEAQVIAYAFKRMNSYDEASVEPKNLIFIAMINLKEQGIEDTKAGISNLRKGGVRTIILAPGNDAAELRAIGEKCGILGPDSDDDSVITIEQFRGSSDEERTKMTEKIQLLGNSQIPDKIDLIKDFQKQGHVVAFVGKRMIDAPALKQADVGIVVGTRSCPFARESSNIGISDDKFLCFLEDLIQAAKCLQGNIKKLVQLQLIFTLSSSLINCAATSSSGHAPMTTIELGWLNLAIPFCGGLALLTGSLTKAQGNMYTLNSISNKALWRNIGIQVVYQTGIFLVLVHKGKALVGDDVHRLKSTIYHGFFLCQIFNIFVAREPEKTNIFRGLFHESKWFFGGLTLAILFLMASLGAEILLGISPWLRAEEVCACLIIGYISGLLDFCGKRVHHELLARC